MFFFCNGLNVNHLVDTRKVTVILFILIIVRLPSRTSSDDHISVHYSLECVKNLQQMAS